MRYKNEKNIKKNKPFQAFDGNFIFESVKDPCQRPERPVSKTREYFVKPDHIFNVVLIYFSLLSYILPSLTLVRHKKLGTPFK